ncbi:hypothetical protein AKJ16_DCAP04308 [Drosera capensis]
MATVDSTSPASDPISLAKENLKPMNGRLKELQESRAELMYRLQSLKQDLHNWKSKLDTHVKIYRDELSEVKKSLNDEVEQLRSDFQGLRTTLQQQHEDLIFSLRNAGLEAALRNEQMTGEHKAIDHDADNNIGDNQAGSIDDSITDGHKVGAENGDIKAET